MDLKKWAGNKMGEGAPPAPTGATPPSGGASASGTPAGGPKSVINPELSSADLPPAMQQWAQAGGNSPEHPQGQPTWAADAAAYAHALALVKKDWPSYKEPWAAVGAAYNAMAGASRPPAPPVAPGAHPPVPGAPPRPPAPGGGVPVGRPNPFGGAR